MKALVYAFALLAVHVSLAQVPSEVLEDYVDKSTYEIDDQNLQEATLLRKYEKLNINSASREELSDIGVLSVLQLNSFFNHRQTYGSLLTLYELKVIPEFDAHTIEQLLPHIYLNDWDMPHLNRGSIKDFVNEENQYFMARTERTVQSQKGYLTASEPSSQYLGSPFKYYARYRFNKPDRFGMGFTVEKDAGESMKWKTSKRHFGFDHIVGHLQWQNLGILKNLIIGNFTMSAGQGLVFANGMYLAKSAESVLFVKRNQIGLMPFSSILESGYFQGVGTTLKVKETSFTFFSSLKRSDSRLNQDTSNLSEQYVNTIYNTGFHRTSKEYDNKNTIRQIDLGYNLRWSKANFTVGNSTSFTSFHLPANNERLNIMPKTRAYNLYDFKGSQNLVSSIDLNYYYRNFNFFGELALQHNGGRGLVVGNQVSLGRRVDFAFVYRNYNHLFQSFYGNGFAEYFNNNDEQGAYVGIKLSPNKKWIFTAYFDLFNNKYLKYRQYTPGQGSEYLLSCSYKPQKKIGLYLQLRKEEKLKNVSSGEQSIYNTTIAKRTVATLTFKYELEKNLMMQTKVYAAMYTQGQTSKGLVLAQDLTYKHKRFTISTRFAVFDTDDYNSRIYLYERDVLYAFSFPAYQGKGLRYYAILQYSPSTKLKVWLRWCQTQYHDRERIGVSGEEVIGHQTDEIKIQMMWLLGKKTMDPKR